MKNVWTATVEWRHQMEWTQRIEQKMWTRIFELFEMLKMAFVAVFSRIRKNNKKIDTKSSMVCIFFYRSTVNAVRLFVHRLFCSSLAHRSLCRTLCNIVIFVSDDVWTTQRQWWWYCSCCCWCRRCCSGATDHHVYTLCVIKFVDCVPTWIQIIHANNGDVHRNGITTFFPVCLTYIPHHLFPAFSVFYVLFCTGFPLPISRSLYSVTIRFFSSSVRCWPL